MLNARIPGGLRRFGLACLFGMLCLAPAQGQTLSPEVSRGLAWLQSQIQADGRLANEASSVATALQNRSETGQALVALATLPSNLADAIASESDGNTEYLARQAIALIAAARDASAQINLLLQRRNSDRGFGGGPGFESNPLDTAWVVLALARAGQGAGTPARDARAYLMASLQSDGGVAAANDALRIEYSAAALYALQTAGDGSTATTVRALSAWLLQRQGADGSWQGDTYLTAFSVIAVAPTTSDHAVRAAASGFLLAGQSAAGSWQDDPFLTALSLRALGAGSASPAAAVLTGRVIDQSTNLPLAGVVVGVSGAASGNATTDAEGRFTVGNLTAGTYSAQVTRSGYSGASLSYTLFAGQTLDAGTIVLSQIATTGIVRGRVTAATGGAALAGVSVSVIGSATLSATTDASGSFEFSSVAPGGIVISASFTGFQSATGSATLAGGQTLVFSPALYTTAETTPTTGRFIGRTVVAGTNAPLAGVAIVLNGAAAGTSAGDGRFDFTLNPQSYTAVYTLAGYDGATQGFLLSAGATVDAGTVALPSQRTTTTITGRVTESSGTPLADATVQVLGGASVTTGADGAYSLSGLTGTSFDLRASATGYASQLVTLQASRPSEVVHNFALASGSVSVAFGDLAVSPTNPGANVDVSVATSISNIGSADTSVLLLAYVIDVDGVGGAPGTVIGAGIAYDTGGNLLGTMQLSPGGAQSVRVVWNTGGFPPGRYALVLGLREPESLTAVAPQGSLLLEKRTSVDVVARTHFSGSVTANPPVLRAGTNTAVRLSALIQNDGNRLLPPQPYTLSVIDTQTNAVAHSQTVQGQPLAVSELAKLAFEDWTPAAGGNFRVEINSPHPAEGKVTTPLYVGDSGSARYTTNKLVVPAGTQTVRANVKVTGQQVTDGTISDPLAPLIKAAVQKAVTRNDTVAASAAISSRCVRCHVQSQALVGGELTRKVATFDANNRNTIFNALTEHQQSNGAIDGFGRGYQMTQSMLGMWALNAWHKKDEIVATLVKGAQYLMSVQDGAGAWSADVVGAPGPGADHVLGWWRTKVANTAFNVKSLAEVHKTLSAAPAGTVVNHVATPWVQGVFSSFATLTSDAAGNLYVSAYHGGQVLLVNPDGTSQPYMTGLSFPTQLVFAGDGTPYVASFGGLYQREPNGSKTLVTSLPGSGLTLGADGNLYMASYWNNAIYKITPSGTVTNHIVGGGLRNPWGITTASGGELVVANYEGANILRYHADKTFDTVVGWTGGNPINIQSYGSGWLAATTTGLYTYNSEWQGQRVLYTIVNSVALTPNGGIVTVDSTNTLYRVSTTPIDSAAALAAMDASIAKGVNWLLQDANTDSNNNLSLAQRLIGLGAARTYYQGQPLADTLQAKMEIVATLLRSRPNPDGGWSWNVSSAANNLVWTGGSGFGQNQPQFIHTPQAMVDYFLTTGPPDTFPGAFTNCQSAPTGLGQGCFVFAWGTNVDYTATAPTTCAGWGSDSLVTAQVGVALDYLNPSSAAPIVQNAVRWLLSHQQPDGSWCSENGILGTRLAATTWVSIWLPIVLDRMGGIDTDLSVTFRANVTMSNPDKAPTSSTANADGTKTYLWKLGGVTADGQDINYDLTLADMNVNEVRAVSSDAHLTFKNTFSGGNVDAPIDIPRVTASAFLALGLTTDRTTYGANIPVNVTGQVTNTDGGLVGGSVRFEIFAPDGVLVATVGTLPFSNLPAGASTNLGPVWNTGGTLAGAGYYVQATLSDSLDRFVAAQRSVFAVVADAGALVSGRTTTDKPSYLPSETVRVTSRVTNLTQNQPLDGLSAVTTVVNPDGSVRFTQTESIAQLVQGGLKDFAYALALGFAQTGTYAASLSVRDAGGTVLATAATSFTVQSSAATGSGLTGTLTAAPKPVPFGAPITFSAAVSNLGNADIAAFAAKISIVDPAAQLVLAEFPATLNIARLQSSSFSAIWAATAAVGGTYVAVLTATVGATTLTLAQDSFTIIAQPVQLDVAIAKLRQARALVLLSCQPDHDHDEHDDDSTHGHGRDNHDGRHHGHDDDDDHGSHPQDESGLCSAQRKPFLDDYLSGLGITHLITTSEAQFKRAFRSGQYNTYWITGGSEKLHHDLDEELREAIYRGDALLLDGVHDERNHELDAIAGVNIRGKLNPSDQTISLIGPIFATGTLATVGRPLKLDLTTGQVQAVFPVSANRPAIVTNQYGLGRGLLFAYDLVGTLMAQPSAALTELVSAGIGWVAPEPAAVSAARSYTVLRGRVTNVGAMVELKATFTPPAGASVLATAPAAVPDASGRPVWSFTLDSGATKNLDLGLRLPATTGSTTASLAIDSVRNGLTSAYGTFETTLSVESAETIAPRVAGELAALTITLSSDKLDRNAAVSSIQAARSSIASGAYEQAIGQLLTAAERLLKITSVDVSDHRVQIGRMMQEAQVRWAAAQP